MNFFLQNSSKLRKMENYLWTTLFNISLKRNLFSQLNLPIVLFFWEHLFLLQHFPVIMWEFRKKIEKNYLKKKTQIALRIFVI